MSKWGVSKVMGSLDLDISVVTDLIEHHSLAKKGPYGLIVAIADCMAVVYKVWEEVIVRHNCSMVNHGSKLVDQISGLREEVALSYPERSAAFLIDILDQCMTMAIRVDSMDNPMFGTGMRT
jgi:hypothetical protein